MTTGRLEAWRTMIGTRSFEVVTGPLATVQQSAMPLAFVYAVTKLKKTTGVVNAVYLLNLTMQHTLSLNLVHTAMRNSRTSALDPISIHQRAPHEHWLFTLLLLISCLHVVRRLKGLAREAGDCLRHVISRYELQQGHKVSQARRRCDHACCT